MAMNKKHMWLEAKLPSESDWIPLDPSFKRYVYVTGLESPLSLTSTSKLLNEYFYESEFLSDAIACPSIRWYRHIPSQVITALDVFVGTWCYENGTIAKIELEPEGMSIDFTHETIFAVGTAGDREEKAFMLAQGMLGSCLEHDIFEQLYSIESVSTMKILELANNRDIRIYTITAKNIGNALPALQLPDYVKNEIKADVNAGQIVVVPEKEIQILSLIS
jgi:hypothetical protein